MKYLITILTLLLINNSINSQTVGLVLSGGGAKGLAHIGVIKALEENEIPIDFVAGTSMGADIGALYAMGYSPEEMIELFKSKDFYYWSTGEINENQKFYANSNQEDASILSFEVKVDSSFLKPVLPTHLISTHQMDLAFLELFAEGTAISNGNFDKLFVPFRCVASDIQNKAQIVFKNGDLGEAVRASMTIPLYFKPLIIKGKILFDGGIYNNFPWKELKKDFNPDFLIGSKVASNTKPPQEDDILLQLENMIVGQTDYEISDTASQIIQTNLKDVNVLDFSRIDYIVNEGYVNTLKRIEIIKSKVLRRESKDSLRSRRIAFKTKLPKLRFKDINLTGLNKNQTAFIQKSVNRKKNDFSIKTLKNEYYKLITDDFLKRLYPLAVYDESSTFYNLNLKADLKKNIDIGLGGNISSSSINQGFISATYNYLGKTSNRIYSNIYFGRLYSSLDLSFRIKFPGRNPLVLESSVILSRLDYYRSSGKLFFEDVKPSYIIKNEAFGDLCISIPFSNNVVLSNIISFGGLDNDYYQVDNFTHNDTPDKTYFTFWNNSLKLEKKTLNKKQYSYRGRKQFIKINFITGEEEHQPGTTSINTDKSYKNHSWFNVKFFNESYHRIFNDRFWLGLLLDANYSNMPLFNNSTASMLVSTPFNPNPYSKTVFIKNLRSDKYIAFGLIPNIKLFKETYFRVEGYAFQPFKEFSFTSIPQEVSSTTFKSIRYIAAISLISHTPVGPICISLNYFPKEQKELFLIFNYGFILFNKRALE